MTSIIHFNSIKSSSNSINPGDSSLDERQNEIFYGNKIQNSAIFWKKKKSQSKENAVHSTLQKEIRGPKKKKEHSNGHESTAYKKIKKQCERNSRRDHNLVMERIEKEREREREREDAKCRRKRGRKKNRIQQNKKQNKKKDARRRRIKKTSRLFSFLFFLLDQRKRVVRKENPKRNQTKHLFLYIKKRWTNFVCFFYSHRSFIGSLAEFDWIDPAPLCGSPFAHQKKIGKKMRASSGDGDAIESDLHKERRRRLKWPEGWAGGGSIEFRISGPFFPTIPAGIDGLFCVCVCVFVKRRLTHQEFDVFFFFLSISSSFFLLKRNVFGTFLTVSLGYNEFFFD